MKLGNKFFAELFGTFVLVFGGCGTALFGHVGFLGVAIAFGLTVIAMAYGIGHISGAHLNPAVSFGVFVNGRMSFKEMLVYWLAQFIGGIIAGLLLMVIAKSAGMALGTFAANGYGDSIEYYLYYFDDKESVRIENMGDYPLPYTNEIGYGIYRVEIYKVSHIPS